tara:strand:+ start:6633 stop:7718 length:1086 start_codon:yes stop_codon:yes gene_type:complete
MNNKSDSFEHYELISAYLDGEVTKEERAFIEDNPDVLKEVDKLKEIKKVTSSLLPIDPILQEKHLANALSSLPKDGKVIPFKQQKLIQRGAFLAVAAAAAAFILIPVINSQNNEPDSESDLATSFIESSTSTTSSAQSNDSQELEAESAVSDSETDSGTTAGAPQSTKASQNNEPESEAATASGIASAETEDQIPNEEVEEVIKEQAIEEQAIEEQAIEEDQEESEVEDQRLMTSDGTTGELNSRVFEEENETVNSLLETASNIWEVNTEFLSSPLAPSQIENFFDENLDFFTCWTDEPFFDTSIRAPLFLQQLTINGIPSLVLISEDLQSELDPVLSVYQVDSSCLVLFEGPISGEMLLE